MTQDNNPLMSIEHQPVNCPQIKKLYGNWSFTVAVWNSLAV